MSGKPTPLAPRFWARVEKTDTCWLWRGVVKPNGYGKIYGEGRYWNVHRLSWTLHNGPIPDSLHVCHRCDVRQCVRPDHLFLGTHRDNMVDCHRKGRAAPSPFGNPLTFAIAMRNRNAARGSRIDSAKLTEADVLNIKRLLPAAGNAEIARRYGVQRATIRRIRIGETWTHVRSSPAAP